MASALAGWHTRLKRIHWHAKQGEPRRGESPPVCAAGGQILSAIVGCTVRLVLRDVIWLSAALAMSLALLVMILTGTTHPPGAESWTLTRP